ncbi:MAG: energy transducer TonB [Flavobacterium sp.]
MSNVSIFEKKWLDLVFEGKNQKYGAYQLRRDSSKTTLFAFIFGITFLGGNLFLLSSFNEKPKKEIIISCPLAPVSPKDFIKPKENSKPKTEQPKRKTSAVKTPRDNQNYVVAPKEEAVIPVATNSETPRTNATTTSEGEGTGTRSNRTNSGTETNVTPKITDGGTHKTSELDRQPNFPGGLKGFYEYIGNHFDKQEVVEGETFRVLVSFVIEKNGSMTNIEIVQKTTSEIDQEAIRVLKSLKTKWEPGYKDGEAVRTRYTLPIVVSTE